VPQSGRAGGELEPHQHREHDHCVYQRGGSTRAHPRQLQAHGDVLWGLDVELLA